MVPELVPVILEFLGPPSNALILDFGSSTHEYRFVRQPFIEQSLMKPLRKRGNRIIHADIKIDAGVDLLIERTGPIPATDGLFDFAMANSVLEHVSEPRYWLKELYRVLSDGGLLIADVPSEWQHHPDPIDTLLRMRSQAEWEVLLGGLGWEILDFRLVAKHSIVKLSKEIE